MVAGAAAREADEILGARVATGEPPQVGHELHLAHPVGDRERASERTEAGICSNSSSIEERPTAASIARTSASVCGLNLTGRQWHGVRLRCGPRASSSPYFVTRER